MIIKGRVYKLLYIDDEDMPFPHVKKLLPQPLVLALENERITGGVGKVTVLYKGESLEVPVWHLFDPNDVGGNV